MALIAGLSWGCHRPPDSDSDEPVDSGADLPSGEVTCTPDATNALRAHCTVLLDEAGPAAVTLEASDLSVVFSSEISAEVHEIPVYGLVADTEWTYSLGTSTGTFRTGALPEEMVLDVTITTHGTPSVEHLLLPAACAERSRTQIVAIDTLGRVRWYQYFVDADDQPMTLVGFRYTDTSSVIGMSQYAIAEYDLTGAPIWRLENAAFPMHHDVFRRNGLTYVLQANLYSTPAPTDYIEDIVTGYDVDGSVAFQWEEHGHLDPSSIPADGNHTWDDEFPGGTDAWHTNALYVEENGDFLLSLLAPSTVLRVRADTGEIDWTLAGDGVGSTVPTTLSLVNPTRDGFSSQHNVQVTPTGSLLLFDNGGNGAARGVEYDLDLAGGTATLQSEWPFPSAGCFIQSSIYALADGHQVMTCADDHVAVELDETGSEVWRAEIACPGGIDLPLTLRGYPLDLWDQQVGDVVASHPTR